jgi:hypothetical protein
MGCVSICDSIIGIFYGRVLTLSLFVSMLHASICCFHLPKRPSDCKSQVVNFSEFILAARKSGSSLTVIGVQALTGFGVDHVLKRGVSGNGTQFQSAKYELRHITRYSYSIFSVIFCLLKAVFLFRIGVFRWGGGSCFSWGHCTNLLFGC